MKHDLFAPDAGAIYRCWFPNSETVFAKGDKFRPVLLMQVRRREDETLEVFVAYGTSQRTDRIGRGEFVVRKSPTLGLEADTKFTLAKACWLPVTEHWFSDETGVACLGTLPVKLHREFYRAAKECGFV